jgi:hypothetical protein
MRPPLRDGASGLPARTQPPDYCGIYHADVLTGATRSAPSGGAVSARGTGQGQHRRFDAESMLSLTLNELQWSQFEAKQTQRPMFGPIETTDGLCDGGDRSETFQSLMKVIGHPEWVSDPRFAKYSDRRKTGKLMEGVRRGPRGDDRAMPRGAQRSGRPSLAYVPSRGPDPQSHRGAWPRSKTAVESCSNLPFHVRRRAAAADVDPGEHTVPI